MIISASRRTDIPAFYADWLLNRLRQGVVLVRNPLNFRQVSRISLSADRVDCLVFWTKNPKPLLPHLAELDRLGYPYYFLFTLTPYGPNLEPGVPELVERLDTFRRLADRLGRHRLIWRYDPILLSRRYSAAYHVEAFGHLAGELSGCTERCIVSFVQLYRKCRRNLQGLELKEPGVEERAGLVQKLAVVAAESTIGLQLCASDDDLGLAGVPAGKCIDDRLISRLVGAPVVAGKDRHQRRACGCIASVDIGAYDSCPHLCRYCYANNSPASITRNLAGHHADSPLLYGRLEPADRVRERVGRSLRTGQLPLF